VKASTPFTLLLLLVPAALSARDAEVRVPGDKWTATEPSINLAHIDFGEINRHGEAAGYHHRPNGVDPAGSRVRQIIQPPDRSGVYRARVSLRDPQTGVWIDKKAPSTFFPDAMSDQDIIGAILAAFHGGSRHGDGQFVGSSGRGFAIEGWYQNGRINSAYPLRGP
jgi:hypothetical protein